MAGVVCDEVMTLPLSVAKTQKYDWVGMQTGLGVQVNFQYPGQNFMLCD